jgi:signal transduction histidine kinase
LVEDLRAERALPQGATEYLEVIQTEIRRLNALAENFLRLSRPAPPNLGPVDVGEILRHVLTLVAREADDRKVEVRPELPGTGPIALGDEGQLCQVFLNVILNALQAIQGGGTVRVAAAPAGRAGMVEVQVADTGTGVSSDDLGRIFDPYFTTRPGGLGLGLAIARRIVEDHHGQITVRSTPGVGTLVGVRIPAP